MPWEHITRDRWWGQEGACILLASTALLGSMMEATKPMLPALAVRPVRWM